jgi:hypothetical protein
MMMYLFKFVGGVWDVAGRQMKLCPFDGLDAQDSYQAYF